MWQLIKSNRGMAHHLTLLTFAILITSSVSCEDRLDRYEKFLAEREQEYLEQVAKVFKEHGSIGYSSSGMEHVEFIRKLQAIEPPSHFKSRHNNLIDVHILNADVKLHIERLEPWEQKQWRRQGYDDVARCSRVLEDWSVPASSEYQLACNVLDKARSILRYETSSWEINIFEIYGGDLYDLHD